MKKCSSDYFSPMFSRRKLIVSLSVISAGLIIACSTALYIPSENLVTPNTSIDELREGRTAYINKCGGCHTLIVPEKHTPQEWKRWVDKMEPMVKMTEKEKESILKYLTKGEK